MFMLPLVDQTAFFYSCSQICVCMYSCLCLYYTQASETDWRVVTKFLEDEWLSAHPDEGVSEITDPGYKKPRPLDFDSEKHKVLCSELKYLYTAITRSRVNVWLYDEDEGCRLPMFDYFRRRQLVRVRSSEGDGENLGSSAV